MIGDLRQLWIKRPELAWLCSRERKRVSGKKRCLLCHYKLQLSSLRQLQGKHRPKKELSAIRLLFSLNRTIGAYRTRKGHATKNRQIPPCLQIAYNLLPGLFWE